MIHAATPSADCETALFIIMFNSASYVPMGVSLRRRKLGRLNPLKKATLATDGHSLARLRMVWQSKAEFPESLASNLNLQHFLKPGKIPGRLLCYHRHI